VFLLPSVAVLHNPSLVPPHSGVDSSLATAHTTSLKSSYFQNSSGIPTAHHVDKPLCFFPSSTHQLGEHIHATQSRCTSPCAMLLEVVHQEKVIPIPPCMDTPVTANSGHKDTVVVTTLMDQHILLPNTQGYCHFVQLLHMDTVFSYTNQPFALGSCTWHLGLLVLHGQHIMSPTMPSLMLHMRLWLRHSCQLGHSYPSLGVPLDTLGMELPLSS